MNEFFFSLLWKLFRLIDFHIINNRSNLFAEPQMLILICSAKGF